MHPAASIIVFTTLSGFGYGLAALLGLGVFDPAEIATKGAHVLALVLIGAGLMSSTLHLGNPQRAWRAFSQWRTSWLSREGVMAVLTFVPLTLSAWLCLFENRYLALPGLVGTAGCAITVYCTAMIYGSLKSIDAWHTWLTPLCYLLFAAAGGVLLGGTAAAGAGQDVLVLALSSIVVLAACWCAKFAWWQRLAGLAATSTPESATGLGNIGRVKLFERPHVNDNYLTREMGYRVARKHSDKLKLLALFTGAGLATLGVLLAAFIGSGALAIVFYLAATASFAIGVAAERWLFFAEARHAVMNYY